MIRRQNTQKRVEQDNSNVLSPAAISDGNALKPLKDFLFVLLGLFLVLACVFIVVRTLDHELVVTCKRSPYVKLTNPDSTKTALISMAIRNFLAFWLIRMILVYTAVSTWWWSSKVRKMRVIKVMMGLFIAYFPSIISLEYIKFGSEDYECSDHGNSISGHAFYFCWALLVLWYITRFYKRERLVLASVATTSGAPDRKLYRLLTLFDKYFLISSIPVAAIGLGIQAFFTYYYGYHSLQQMILGIMIAIIQVGICVGIAEYFIMKTE